MQPDDIARLALPAAGFVPSSVDLVEMMAEVAAMSSTDGRGMSGKSCGAMARILKHAVAQIRQEQERHRTMQAPELYP